ncbi:MAG: hypothetical protein Q9227_000048 [Pyrenula ochraceoflavens]
MPKIAPPPTHAAAIAFVHREKRKVAETVHHTEHPKKLINSEKRRHAHSPRHRFLVTHFDHTPPNKTFVVTHYSDNDEFYPAKSFLSGQVDGEEFSVDHKILKLERELPSEIECSTSATTASETSANAKISPTERPTSPWRSDRNYSCEIGSLLRTIREQAASRTSLSHYALSRIVTPEDPNGAGVDYLSAKMPTVNYEKELLNLQSKFLEAESRRQECESQESQSRHQAPLAQQAESLRMTQTSDNTPLVTGIRMASIRRNSRSGIMSTIFLQRTPAIFLPHLHKGPSVQSQSIQIERSITCDMSKTAEDALSQTTEDTSSGDSSLALATPLQDLAHSQQPYSAFRSVGRRLSDIWDNCVHSRGFYKKRASIDPQTISHPIWRPDVYPNFKDPFGAADSRQVSTGSDTEDGPEKGEIGLEKEMTGIPHTPSRAKEDFEFSAAKAGLCRVQQ